MSSTTHRTLSRILFVILSCSHDKSVADLVTHGVEVRKLCASCDEEVPLDPNPNPDTKGLGYCEGYGKDATVSGLVVIPTDAQTGQTIIPGNIPTSIWGHPTIGKLYVCRFAIMYCRFYWSSLFSFTMSDPN